MIKGSKIDKSNIKDLREMDVMNAKFQIKIAQSEILKLEKRINELLIQIDTYKNFIDNNEKIT